MKKPRSPSLPSKPSYLPEDETQKVVIWHGQIHDTDMKLRDTVHRWEKDHKEHVIDPDTIELAFSESYDDWGTTSTTTYLTIWAMALVSEKELQSIKNHNASLRNDFEARLEEFKEKKAQYDIELAEYNSQPKILEKTAKEQRRKNLLDLTKAQEKFIAGKITAQEFADLTLKWAGK